MNLYENYIQKVMQRWLELNVTIYQILLEHM